jgi:hypothetical protein
MHTVALAIIGGLIGHAAAETIHGALVFSRHGDRKLKMKSQVE